MSRRLVLTADDLGRESATSAEIAQLTSEGLITATTLIAVSPDSADAATLFADAPIVPHLHVCLTSDTDVPRWRPRAADVASLADTDGAFNSDPFLLGARGETRDVIAEADAQLAWMLAHGLRPSVADSHTGTLYGLHGRSWLEAALRWCAENELAFRLPRDANGYMGGPLPEPLASAHAQAVALADQLGVLIPATIMTNRRSAAELGSYEAMRDGYLARLEALPNGVSELFLHPSRPGAVAGDNGILRIWEARLLRDELWRAKIDAEEVELVASW